MLKQRYKNSKRVEVEPIRSKKSWDDLCYSTENSWSEDLDELNELFFDRNKLMMKQLESIQAGF